MKLSKKSLFLPLLAAGLISGPAIAGISESSALPQEIAAIQPQPPAQPLRMRFDGAPEALHIVNALIGGLVFAKAKAFNDPFIVPTVILGTGLGYFMSKWFDNNVMN